MTTLPPIQERLAQLPRPMQQQTIATAALTAPAAGLAALGAEVVEREPIAREQAAMLWLHVHTSPWLLQMSEFLHVFGGPKVMLPVILLIPLLLWVRHQRPQALFALAALVSSAALQWGLKLAFGRPRPDLWPYDVHTSGLSFPSGHATTATALALVIGLLAWRTPYRWAAATAGTLYAAVMALSRVILGVHYPSDVLAGALTATLSVVTVFLMMRRSLRVE